MNYLVIDLEMCKVPKHYRSKKYKYANEIIQVGAVSLGEALMCCDIDVSGRLHDGIWEAIKQLPERERHAVKKYLDAEERCVYEQNQQAYVQGIVDCIEILSGAGIETPIGANPPASFFFSLVCIIHTSGQGMGAKSQPISPPFWHKAGLPPSKKYLLVRQPPFSNA